MSKHAGIGKRVFPHLLRHSDAIIRLRRTGNPRALQYHLGHSMPAMTLRYLSTLTREETNLIYSSTPAANTYLTPS